MSLLTRASGKMPWFQGLNLLVGRRLVLCRWGTPYTWISQQEEYRTSRAGEGQVAACCNRGRGQGLGLRLCSCP